MKDVLNVWIKKKSDIFDYHAFEVKAAFFVSFSLLSVFVCLGIYDDFINYIDAIKNLVIYILQAFIGLLGTILAGLSIMLFLFSSKGLEKIGQTNETGHKMLLSYIFLCINIVFSVFLLIVLYFLLHFPRDLVNVLWFFTITFFITYYIFFVLFYTVALINNAVVLYRIDSRLRFKINDDQEVNVQFVDIVERVKIYINIRNGQVSLNEIIKVTDLIISSLNCTLEVKKKLTIKLENYFSYLKV